MRITAGTATRSAPASSRNGSTQCVKLLPAVSGSTVAAHGVFDITAHTTMTTNARIQMTMIRFAVLIIDSLFARTV